MTTKTQGVKKAVAFKWNEENTAQAVELYLETLNNAADPDANTTANSEAHLSKIAQTVGAKSSRSVRGKLSKEGVYKALEVTAAPSTSTRISKGQYVRSLSKGLDLDLEMVQSLDKANLDALSGLLDGVNRKLVAIGQEPIKVA